VGLARWSIKVAVAAGVPLLALILFKFWLTRHPAFEARLFPWDGYPLFEAVWYLVPTFFLAGAGLYAARTSRLKRDALLVLTGLLVLRTGLSAGHSHEGLRGQVDASGVCRQSAAYSCAPAAVAAYLHLLGVEAGEREMALLCATRPGLGGTSECGVMRGLRHKVGEHARVLMSTPAYEDIPAPSIVTLHISWLVDHCVMVERVGKADLTLMDPARGRTTLSRADFEGRWKGVAIFVQPQ
jgi:hypothetical protein